MTRMPVYVYECDGPHVLIRGNVRDWLKANRIPAMRSAMRRGWWVRRDRLPDLLARLDAAGFAVRTRSKLAPMPAPVPRSPRSAAEGHRGAFRTHLQPVCVDGQLALLEVGESA